MWDDSEIPLGGLPDSLARGIEERGALRTSLKLLAPAVTCIIGHVLCLETDADTIP